MARNKSFVLLLGVHNKEGKKKNLSLRLIILPRRGGKDDDEEDEDKKLDVASCSMFLKGGRRRHLSSPLFVSCYVFTQHSLNQLHFCGVMRSSRPREA